MNLIYFYNSFQNFSNINPSEATMNAIKPRVQISYDIETENGTVKKELPFVIGILGDFSGSSKKKAQELSKRRFIEINQDNFSNVMKSFLPGVNINVKNHIDKSSEKINLNLQFESIKDFEPMGIIQQVPQLKQIYDTKKKLVELLEKSERSHQFKLKLEEAFFQSSFISNI